MRMIDADTLPKLLDAEYEQTMKLIREGEKHLDTLAEGFTEASHIAKYIAPTVDAVPVVRCKDCAFSQLDGWLCGGIGMMPEHPTFPDSFCENGIRKDGDDHA